MKDYFAYTLMNKMGVAAPLCSFVQINVNGEPWGLYLAVEGVEDAFLQRNYGKDHGELNKPDALSMGGGRGNGEDFDMDAAADESGFNFGGNEENADGMPAASDNADNSSGDSSGGSSGAPEGEAEPTATATPQPTATPAPAQDGSTGDSAGDAAASDGDAASEGNAASAGTPAEGEQPAMTGDAPADGAAWDTANRPQKSADGNTPDGSARPERGADFEMPNMDFGGFGGFGSSSDVKLQYSNDNPSSYSNIFNNAKTDITAADQTRLIASIKALNEGDVSVVDTDSVIRYMAVHNFLCNGDSYTGMMAHNYYLYEENGVLSMIPWDYNLGYGGFSGDNATSTVNTTISRLVSMGNDSDRPMAA